MNPRRLSRAILITAAALTVAACAQQPRLATVARSGSISYSAADRECMARAMFFESHRGADEGMLAVGSVVANRLASGRYGATVCEVVGQKRQFAPGVLTRTMDGEAAERARMAADAVLSGKRHPGVRGAMFFHTAGLKFRFPNMHYVLVAGGNAFYEKREVASATDAAENARSKALAMAYARIDPTGSAKPIVTASLSPAEKAAAAAPVPTIKAVQAPVTVIAAAPAIVAAPGVAAYAAPETSASKGAITLAATKPEPAKRVIEPAVDPVLASAAPPAPVFRTELARSAGTAKRVIDPAKAQPALASAAPVTPASAPEPAPAARPAYVDAAFAAFN